MDHPISPHESRPPVVLDTSVVINIIGSGIAEAVLHTIAPIVVVQNVQDELTAGGEKAQASARLLRDLISKGVIQLRALTDVEEGTFESLVAGRGEDTLDDGEAATLAYAHHHGGVAAIDENKARRICTMRFPMVALLCSVELFQRLNRVNTVKHVELADAVYKTLINSRMKVRPQEVPWVVQLIGLERARQCKSLPRSSKKDIGR